MILNEANDRETVTLSSAINLFAVCICTYMQRRYFRYISSQTHKNKCAHAHSTHITTLAFAVAFFAYDL